MQIKENNAAIIAKQKSFEEEIKPSMSVMRIHALAFTSGNIDDANDLLQNTYLNAFRFWNSYKKGTNIGGWLYRIMKNYLINDYYKKTNNLKSVNFEDVKNFYETIRHSSTNSSDLQRQIFEEMIGDEVLEALSALPPIFEKVVILVDIEGMNYEQAAKIFNCPVSTIGPRLSRAHKLLKKKLKRYGKSLGYNVR
ncbi:MAG: sigma-70 family RNA polymerase sigma factor [Patescibacteria group bacterium]